VLHSDEVQRRYEILKTVVERLLLHRPDTRKYPVEQQHPFSLIGLKKNDDSKHNLKKLLVFGLQWRGGPRLNLNKINRALSDFDVVYDTVTREILPDFSGQKTTDAIYRHMISDVKYVGPKIGGVFLRDIVYHLGVWKELLPFLYLPIDRHVRSLLIDRLNVYDEKDVPGTSEPFSTKKNQKFQNELSTIHTPRVDFDDLWFMGSHFCSYRKMCPVCWIRDLCTSRFENTTTLNL